MSAKNAAMEDDNMKTPIIGISGSIDSGETKQFILRDYMQAVLDSGGIPVLLSMDMDAKQIGRCMESLDGLLLAGGNDLSPALFGEEPIEALGEVNPLRDNFEMMLIRQAYSMNMPVLGICRGIQAMVVALGGRLYQDLPSQRSLENLTNVKHMQAPPYTEPCHNVSIISDSFLHKYIQADVIDVNSTHHQAVREPIPNGVKTIAFAQDGVIEGIEAPDKTFFVGVQWHPERLYKTDNKAFALFEAFINACITYK